MWLLAACSEPPPPPPTATGPAILWISLDTARADRLGVYGGPAATPNLDGLATTAVVYEQAFTNFPETGLSHWSQMTGVLPEVHGNVPASGDSRYTGPTLAEMAKDRGYATAAFIGGITLQSFATGLNRGFDLYDDRVPRDPNDMKRDGDEVVRLAGEWIGAQRTPWFAFVHLFDAHFPYTPDDPGRYDPDYAGPIDGTDSALRPVRDSGAPIAERDLAHVRALYDAELTELDRTIGPLLRSPNTVVMVTADHGESFEHGYLFNHRGSLADGVLRIPWILRAPGVTPARVPEQVAGVDMLPTLLAALGWTTEAPMHGRSVLPPVTTESPVWARTDPWEVFPLAEGRMAPLLVLRSGGKKAIRAGDGTVVSYELATDPGEERPQPGMVDLSAYDGLISAMAPHQRAPLPPRAPDDAAMLNALGYTHGHPPPQGPPPGGPPGPP